jgi:hypothetical protein
MDNYDLKLCPFCGTKAKISRIKCKFKNMKLKKSKHTAYAIGCSDPDCILYNSGQQARLFFTASAEGLEGMAKKWNRRTFEM